MNGTRSDAFVSLQMIAVFSHISRLSSLFQKAVEETQRKTGLPEIATVVFSRTFFLCYFSSENTVQISICDPVNFAYFQSFVFPRSTQIFLWQPSEFSGAWKQEDLLILQRSLHLGSKIPGCF